MVQTVRTMDSKKTLRIDDNDDHKRLWLRLDKILKPLMWLIILIVLAAGITSTVLLIVRGGEEGLWDDWPHGHHLHPHHPHHRTTQKNPTTKTLVAEVPLSRAIVSKVPIAKVPISKDHVSNVLADKVPISKVPESKTPVSKVPVSKASVSMPKLPTLLHASATEKRKTYTDDLSRQSLLIPKTQRMTKRPMIPFYETYDIEDLMDDKADWWMKMHEKVPESPIDVDETSGMYDHWEMLETKRMLETQGKLQTQEHLETQITTETQREHKTKGKLQMKENIEKQRKFKTEGKLQMKENLEKQRKYKTEEKPQMKENIEKQRKYKTEGQLQMKENIEKQRKYKTKGKLQMKENIEKQRMYKTEGKLQMKENIEKQMKYKTEGKVQMKENIEEQRKYKTEGKLQMKENVEKQRKYKTEEKLQLKEYLETQNMFSEMQDKLETQRKTEEKEFGDKFRNPRKDGTQGNLETFSQFRDLNEGLNESRVAKPWVLSEKMTEMLTECTNIVKSIELQTTYSNVKMLEMFSELVPNNEDEILPENLEQIADVLIECMHYNINTMEELEDQLRELGGPKMK